MTALPPKVYHESGQIIVEDDLAPIHGRIRGWADTPQVVIDLFRIQDGRLAEHWDVLQNEVPATAAAGGVAMFAPARQGRGS